MRDRAVIKVAAEVQNAFANLRRSPKQSQTYGSATNRELHNITGFIHDKIKRVSVRVGFAGVAYSVVSILQRVIWASRINDRRRGVFFFVASGQEQKRDKQFFQLW